MPGACHYSQQAATGIGRRHPRVRRRGFVRRPADSASASISPPQPDALLLLAVPTFLIGICKGAMMHCRMVMLPTLIVLGVLTIVFAAIAIWLDSRAAKRN